MTENTGENSVVLEDPKDPFDSLEIPGSQLSLTANRMIQDFTITTDSYVLLSTHLYEVLCIENSEFADKISESAFQYYAIMLLWQRLAQFLPPRSRKLSPFLDKLSYFEPYLTGIPEALETYLKGIGNFEHSYLGEMRFRLPEALISKSFDLTTGCFGKVSADTHFLYEAFPAPGVAALRILADISNTNTFLADAMWDLPKDLRPDVGFDSSVENQMKSELPRPMPTKNLLGWSPAQSLTKNQLELFKTTGIESTASESDISKFFENSSKLLKTVSGYFDGAKKQPISVEELPQKELVPVNVGHGRYSQQPSAKNIPKATPEEDSEVNDSFGSSKGFTKVKRLPFTGSIVQGLSVKKAFESSEFDRCTMYCDGTVSVCSSLKANDNLVTGAVVTGYRMPKQPTLYNRHSWSCYDFNKYECVPQSWISTRNSIYTFKNIEGLNKPMWTTGTTDKIPTLYSFLKKHRMAEEDVWNVYM